MLTAWPIPLVYLLAERAISRQRRLLAEQAIMTRVAMYGDKAELKRWLKDQLPRRQQTADDIAAQLTGGKWGEVR